MQLPRVLTAHDLVTTHVRRPCHCTRVITSHFLVLRHEEIHILCGTAARRITNPSNDISLFEKLLKLYRLSLCALSFSYFFSFHPSRPLTNLLCLIQDHPFAPMLLDWKLPTTVRIRVHTPAKAVSLAALRTALGNELTVLALSTLTVANAAIVVVCEAPVCCAPTPVWPYAPYGARAGPNDCSCPPGDAHTGNDVIGCARGGGSRSCQREAGQLRVILERNN